MQKNNKNPRFTFQKESIYGLLLLFIALFLSACSENTPTISFDYGTQKDSARYYFHQGWEEILDKGRWTASEAAFRKAADLDPTWPLGKSMVGRITRDLEERQQILKELETLKEQASEDERLLLDVNLLSLEASNKRDQQLKTNQESRERRKQLAETNFGQFARKYPEDNYFKAEYIEFLHLNHGAQAALDSLKALASPEQQQLGFYLSYRAALELELGNIEQAKELAAILEEKYPDSIYATPLMLRAQIYMYQDSLKKAKVLVDRVVARDTNHIIAIGMQSSLKVQLERR